MDLIRRLNITTKKIIIRKYKNNCTIIDSFKKSQQDNMKDFN